MSQQVPPVTMAVNPMAMAANPMAMAAVNPAAMMNPLTMMSMMNPMANLALPVHDDLDEDEAVEIPAKASAPVEDEPSSANPRQPAPSRVAEQPGSSKSAIAMTVTGDSFQDACATLQQARDGLYRTTREEMRIPRSIAWLRQIPKAGFGSKSTRGIGSNPK